MPSYLITGSNQKNRINHIEISFNIDLEQIKKTPDPDILIIEPQSGSNVIKIDQIREANTFVTQRPIKSDNRNLIVLNATAMTTQAQNAFLKSLEEPHSKSNIILETRSTNDLLPTIVSRCFIIKIKSDEKVSENANEFEKLYNMADSDLFSHLQKTYEKYKSKEELLEYLEQVIKEGRGLLQKKGVSTTLQGIFEIYSDLKNTNINQKLAIENIFFCFKKSF